MDFMILFCSVILWNVTAVEHEHVNATENTKIEYSGVHRSSVDVQTFTIRYRLYSMAASDAGCCEVMWWRRVQLESRMKKNDVNISYRLLRPHKNCSVDRNDMLSKYDTLGHNDVIDSRQYDKMKMCTKAQKTNNKRNEQTIKLYCSW